MTFLAFLCKVFVLSSTIELGVIPGHDVAMYEIPYHYESLNVDQTYYADYCATLVIQYKPI